VTFDKIPAYCQEVIRSVHNARKGHLGIGRSIQMIRLRRLTYPNNIKIVEKYIRHCMVCQTMRSAKLMMNAYDPQLCTDPWRVVYMDHITKLPKTSRGNTAILVLIDAATHFALLFAVRSLSEEDVVYALSQMFAFVGAPTQFVTDHFKSFKAYGYRAFCKLTGTTPELAKANNSKSHGLVERANQEVLSHIGDFKSENFRYEWDTLLGLTNYVINDTISSLTGFPPRVLLFGSQHAKDTVNIRTLSEHEKTFHPKTVRNYLLSQDYIIARMYELVHDRLD